MARPKGQPKLGGRKKGTPNKKTLMKESFIDAITSALGCSPIEEIIKNYNQMDAPDKAKLMKDMLPYMYPKLSTVEVKADELKNPILLKYAVGDLKKE